MGESFNLNALTAMFADFAMQLNKFFQDLKDFFAAIADGGIDADDGNGTWLDD